MCCSGAQSWAVAGLLDRSCCWEVGCWLHERDVSGVCLNYLGSDSCVLSRFGQGNEITWLL